MSYFLDSDPVFITHGAAGTSVNPNYDPVKRKEYYERSKTLKGRLGSSAQQPMAPQGSTSEIANHKLKMQQAMASIQQAIRVARAKGGKGKSEILNSISALRKQNDQAISDLKKALKDGQKDKGNDSSNKSSEDETNSKRE